MSHKIIGPIAALLSVIVTRSLDMPLDAALTLAIVIWVAWWWVSECIPLAITALLPFILLPIIGVLDPKEAATALGDNIILLFMAAFMMAKAIEASGVHKRLALSLIALIGPDSGRRIVVAFMCATAFLSMWISNTASVLALLPVALALADATDNKPFQKALLLGLAYSGSVGGIATLVGTPPNLIFASIYENISGQGFDFTRWLGIGIPMMVISIPLMAWYLTRNIHLSMPLQLPQQDKMSAYERRVLTVFGVVVLL